MPWCVCKLNGWFVRGAGLSFLCPRWIMNKANICFLVLEEQWVGELWPQMRGMHTDSSEFAGSLTSLFLEVEHEALLSMCNCVGIKLWLCKRKKTGRLWCILLAGEKISHPCLNSGPQQDYFKNNLVVCRSLLPVCLKYICLAAQKLQSSDMTLQTNTCFCLLVIFAGRTLEMHNNVLEFAPFVHSLPDCELIESKFFWCLMSINK